MLGFLLPTLNAISYFQQRTTKETVVTHTFEIKDGIPGEYCSANNDQTKVTCSQIFTNQTSGFYFNTFNYRVDSPIKQFELKCEGSGSSYCMFKFANTWQFESQYYQVNFGDTKEIEIGPNVKQDYQVIAYFICSDVNSEFGAPSVKITKYDGTLADERLSIL